MELWPIQRQCQAVRLLAGKGRRRIFRLQHREKRRRLARQHDGARRDGQNPI